MGARVSSLIPEWKLRRQTIDLESLGMWVKLEWTRLVIRLVRQQEHNP
jgi:hypothetical protein